MGHAMTKPEWTKSVEPHHQVVIEPTSEPRKAHRRLFGGNRRDSHAHFQGSTPPDTGMDDVVRNVPPQELGAHRRSFGRLFGTPTRTRQVSKRHKPTRVPIAQVVVHRPSHTYRAREYLERQIHNRYPESPAYRPSSPDPIHVSVAKRPPEIGGRFLQPPKTLALMDVGSRLVEKGKEGKKEWKESLRAERERRFDDVCREYAALKVETEQDVYRRMKKEQKREAKRQQVYTV